VSDLSPWLGRVTCGDCLELMRELPDGCVSAVVTDPPYGIRWSRGTWDEDPEKYPEFMRWLVAESNRVTAGGPVFVWQSLPNLPRFHEWFPEGFRVFAACKGFVMYRPTPVQWSWDPVVFWGRNGRKPKVGERDYFVDNMAPFGAHREKIDHPCPKQPGMAEYIVKLACPEGGIVCDPFMGSGTTALAAVATGRQFVGFEIDPRYCDLANTRLDAHAVAAQAQRLPLEVAP
jgi:site-specific DNA-methyltransferase (adenine-specific)